MNAGSNRSLADRYGDLKAKMAALEEEVTDLRKQIVASGEESITGEDWRVSVTTQRRESLDSKVVRKFLSPEQIREATRRSTVDVVRVRAFKAEEDE